MGDLVRALRDGLFDTGTYAVTVFAYSAIGGYEATQAERLGNHPLAYWALATPAVVKLHESLNLL